MGRRALSVGDATEFPLGPFAGVYDAPDPGESRRTRLFDAVNVFTPDIVNGSAVVARHGCVGLTQQMGSVSARTAQGYYMHRRLDGTLDRFTFGGGKMYQWDGLNTFTDITPAGVNIDAANPVFATSYNDQLIVADEINKPWVYNPYTGIATNIQIDAINQDWSTKGGPIVYSGKVFFILRRKGAQALDTETDIDITTESDLVLTTELTSGYQNTIVWCEELTPLVGYSQTNYDNTWTLTQTSDEIIAALSGEEGALVYLRNKGIGEITGAVNANFRSSATRDAISSTVGTDAPAAVISINRKIWFVDMDGRVFRAFVSGGEPQQLYFPVRREIDANVGSAANRANVVLYARAAYHEGYNLVLFTIWDRQTVYAFDAATGIFVAEWFIGGAPGASINIDAMGSMIDSNNRTAFVFGGTRDATYTSTSQGVTWRQKHADDVNMWLDQADLSVASYQGLTRAIESHWVSSNAAASFRFTDVEAQVLGDSVTHAVGLEYVVPASGKSAKITAQSTATVGEKSVSDSISSVRWSLGPNAQGTAGRFRISATHSDNERWGVHNVVVKAVVTKARPGAV
jgi:hypothetical protein